MMAMRTGNLYPTLINQGICELPKFQVPKNRNVSSANGMQYADLQSVNGPSGPTIISPQPLLIVGLNLPGGRLWLSIYWRHFIGFVCFSSQLRDLPGSLMTDLRHRELAKPCSSVQFLSVMFYRSEYLLAIFLPPHNPFSSNRAPHACSLATYVLS